MSNRDSFLIGFILGCVSFSILIHVVLHVIVKKETPGKASQHIKTEYFLEVSEDSIKVESLHGNVYQGTYSDLDSIICKDNL